MKLLEISTEKYDKKHKCLTPGTIYKIAVHSDRILIKLELPNTVSGVTKSQAEDLESDLHYAIEKVLAKYYFS